MSLLCDIFTHKHSSFGKCPLSRATVILRRKTCLLAKMLMIKLTTWPRHQSRENTQCPVTLSPRHLLRSKGESRWVIWARFPPTRISSRGWLTSDPKRVIILLYSVGDQCQCWVHISLDSTVASSSHMSGGGTSDIGVTDTQESNICQDASVISPALADQGIIASDSRVSDTAERASPTGRNILAEFSDTDSSVWIFCCLLVILTQPKWNLNKKSFFKLLIALPPSGRQHKK